MGSADVVAEAAATLKGTAVVVPGQPGHRQQWRGLAELKIDEVAGMPVDPAHRGGDGAARQEWLARAQGFLVEQGGPASWWTGAQIDRTFRAVHRAEAEAVASLPPDRMVERVQLLYDARGVLDPTDPVLNTAGAKAQPPGLTPAQARELVLRYRKAWDDRYVRSRSFRNRLIVMIGVATLFITVLVGVGGAELFTISRSGIGEAMVLTVAWPAWVPSVPKLVVMAAIGIFGSIGGLLAGAAQVVRVGGVYNPYYLPIVSLLLKIQMGALCALAGVLAVLGGVASELHATSWGDVAAWALIFGAAQQLVTTLVDRRVNALVSSEPRENVVRK